MTRGRVTAETTIAAYYASKGEEAPSVCASRLLDCIQVRRHRWISPVHESLTEQILERAYFDVDDLAENFLEIRLHVDRLEELDERAGAKVFGCAQPDKRTITICERTLGYEPLYRTTVMHEVGHVLLHQRPQHRSPNYAPNSRRRPPREREADEFMSSCLLPTPVLLLGLARVANAWGMDITSSANTGKGRWQWRKRYFPFLINQLCVSRLLIGVRLRHLGIFTQPTLEYHRTYRLPNRWLKTDRHHHPPGCAFAELARKIKRKPPVTTVDTIDGEPPELARVLPSR